MLAQTEVASAMDVDYEHTSLGDENVDMEEAWLPGNHEPNESEHPAEDATPPRSYRATVEDVLEDGDIRWHEAFPTPAGTPLRRGKTAAENRAELDRAAGIPPWHPFESMEEWEFARWVMTSGVSQHKMNELFKLDMMKKKADPAFHNAKALLDRVDSLPTGPGWSCQSYIIKGDKLDEDNSPMTENVELWYRDPVECIKELMENPAFKGKQAYEPRKIYRRNDYTNREFNESWTADWWWDKQTKLPEGATVTPVHVSTDKTHLTVFTGDKQAWPCYLTVGNIEKSTRRRPSERAMVLIGYIPVCKLSCFTKNRRQQEGQQLFHKCMKKILEPLIEAGLNGVEMVCADAFVRLVYPLLAAYIADYPEQCLVTCCKNNACPKCEVDPDSRGDHRVKSVLRDPDRTLEALDDHADGISSTEFNNQSLHCVDPFWRDLPHCDIFDAMTPDILHQLHKGVFKDHIVKWSTAAMPGQEEEIDARFKSMSLHSNVRHFKKGISLTTQWTGTEHKNMEKVFLGILAGASDPQLILAVRGILDFIYYAHFETHTDESLDHLDAAWLLFHENKEIFEILEIREDFNIPKLHNIKHYYDSIRQHGTADQYNTEFTERLHIDLAKVGYRAGNKRDQYIRHMTVWLQRQEAIHNFCIYLQWAIPGYVAEPEPPPCDEDEVEIDDEEIEVASKALVVYKMAAQPSKVRESVPTLIQEYGTLDIVPKLNEFLRNAGRKPACQDYTRFRLYARVRLLLPPIPEVSSEPVKDAVYAKKGRPMVVTNVGVQDEVHPKFSTALLRTHAAQPNKGPMDGVSIRQIRLIFCLPEELGYFRCLLVYVHWFRPLRQQVAGLDMFETSFSTENRRPRASVVPLDTVMQSCHMIPKYGRQMATVLLWNAETVMIQSKSFYLNPYLRHRDFFLLRYQMARHNILQEARDRAQAEAEIQADLRRQKRRRKHAG